MAYDINYIKERSTQDDCGCWLWTNATNPHGYGVLTSHAPERLAHRLSWLVFNGSIPFGQHVCHNCDNPSCVNPDHLFVGSQHDNITDMVKKGRHFSDTTNAVESRRIPDEVRLQVKDRLAKGYKSGTIAKIFNISTDTVRRIKKETTNG